MSKSKTVAEREAMEDASFGKNKPSSHWCSIFANAVVDEKGERLYKDEDIAAIANYPVSSCLYSTRTTNTTASPLKKRMKPKKLLNRPNRRFLFKQALQLGKTVNELSNELSNDELIEWIAYDRIDPFGNYRMDAQFAQLPQLATQWMGQVASQCR